MYWFRNLVVVWVALAVTLAGCTDGQKPAEEDQLISASTDVIKPFYDLSSLEMELPEKWQLAESPSFKVYDIIDEHGEARGQVSSAPYMENFDFKSQAMPNHSSLTAEEELELPIGKGRLYTLDADNGTAASGKTGTHDTYYAVIPIQDEMIVILDYSNYDKAAQTKQEFIRILSSLRLEVNKITAIRLQCVDLCREDRDATEPFTEKTFTVESEIRVFEQAMNRAIKMDGNLDYGTYFLMYISYKDGTQKEYVLNISNDDQEGLTGLLVDTTDSGQGYEIPEEAHTALRKLIYP